MEKQKPNGKQEQVLILTPEHELHFKGPFEEIVTRVLVLSNPTNKRICFKVKTTAPKRYCVRPNSGFLEPNSSANVAVMLQPLVNVDPAQIATEFKNKHKFMIQAIFVDNDCDKEPNWKDIDSSLIMDSKLRCVFDFKPEQDSAIEQTGNETNALMTSVSSTMKSLETSAVAATNASTQSAQPTTIDNDSTDEKQQLKNQIAKLREEIATLNTNATSLRQRATGSTKESPAGQEVATNAALSMFAKLSLSQQIQVLLAAFVIGLLVGVFVF